MFWIKSNNLKTKNDYLYLRETVYIRDKRSLKRIPRKLGDGKATKNRGKYSKKKDIYCGRIYNIEIKKILSFKNYLEEIQKMKMDFLDYKLTSSFDKILYDFLDYILYIYELDKEIFYGKKKAYFTGSGFLCKETIDYILRFSIKKGSFDNNKELERFAIRCHDSGIYDDEVISALYMKLNNNIKKIDEEQILPIKKGNYNNYSEFMKNQYENEK